VEKTIDYVKQKKSAVGGTADILILTWSKSDHFGNEQTHGPTDPRTCCFQKQYLLSASNRQRV